MSQRSIAAQRRRVTAWEASGCGCTETCPVARDLRGVPYHHVPPGRNGRLRGARSLEDSLHRPLVRRAGWRLVPACVNKEVDACRSVDELSRSGGLRVGALYRSHIEACDLMGASRPRARSVPWGRPPGARVGVQAADTHNGASYGSPRLAPPRGRPPVAKARPYMTRPAPRAGGSRRGAPGHSHDTPPIWG